MSNWGYRLCARYLDGVSILALPEVYPGIPSCDVFEQADPDQLPVYAYSFDTTVFPGHFPFGQNVEPD